jgi:hypothetical protein
MAFGEWTVYNNGMNGLGGQPAAGISLTYFSGSSSLVFSGAGGHGVDDGGDQASANAYPSGLPKGFTSGKMRTLINPVQSGPANHGLMRMQSATNMQAGHDSKGYAIMLDSLLFNNKVVLVRMNDGISPSLGGALGSSYTLLGLTSDDIWTENNIYAIEIEWYVNVLIPGTHVIGRFGTMSDFSDLTVFAEVFDNSSHAVITSIGEGPYASLTTNGLIVAFDNTQMISMIP